MSQVTEGLARSQDGATDAVDRLERMIRAFAKFARKPAIAGGCPIMNTAIGADDPPPELRDRARESMTLWHRLIGRIVKDGIAAGTLLPTPPPYALAPSIPGSLEGGSCSRGSTKILRSPIASSITWPRTSKDC